METQKVINTFNKGKVLIFPTDTVWGIGCRLDKPEAIKRLYQIKKRPVAQPTAVLVANLTQAESLGRLSVQAKQAVAKLWPGAVTLIVPATPAVPKAVVSPDKKIGLRIPKHAWLLKVLAKTGPLVATSANFAGKPAPYKKTMLSLGLLRQTDGLVQGVRVGGKSASVVVDTTTKPVRIIRSGLVKTAWIKELFR